MQIKSMFAKDIDRHISGVIQVGHEDEADVRQELEEYVLTDELRENLDKFLDAYLDASEHPSEAIGVWISGFFGSGKSHFLKMLSYLLGNQVVAGKTAFDYFRPKLADDPSLLAKLERACAVACQSILFNVERKSRKKDDRAILEVFASVFFESLGFSRDVKLALLEREIDGLGHTEEFRAAWERETGKPWVQSRKTYRMKTEALARALKTVPELDMTDKASVQAWLKASEDFTPEVLVEMVSEYLERKSEEVGEPFRIAFCVDEIGQYIGDDSSLMLSLQTIVEEFGSKCPGRAWVMVTSQQAIDDVTKNIAANDFSKIQGRFNTRIKLSSTSAAEVIRRRVLEKTSVATETLAAEYASKEQVLKNLFTFERAKSDLVGYRDEADFCAVYPFVSYQFPLLQSAYDGVRRHGSSGKHMSSAARSMLSSFQEAAQAVEEDDETTLVPFWRFYDTLSEFLEAYVTEVVARCERAATMESARVRPEDARVLKLLFLLKYVDKDMAANLNNLAILMAESVDPDLSALRQSVQDSLDRLYADNYVDKSGDTYLFLTDEEQDIAREINETDAEPSDVLRLMQTALFDDIYDQRKVTLNKNVFGIAGYVDETLCFGKAGEGLTLRIATEAYPLERRSVEDVILRSSDGGGECIVLLPEKMGYYENLQLAARIARYANGDHGSFTETQTAILVNKQAEARSLKKRACDQLRDAIAGARFFVSGNEVKAEGSTARAKVENALHQLIGRRFSKLRYITTNYAEAELPGILDKPEGMTDVDNQRAVDDIESYLQASMARHQNVSMAQIRQAYTKAPRGWREEDICACVLELLRARKAELFRAGAPMPIDNYPQVVRSLMNRSESEKIEVRVRVALDPKLMRRAQDAYKEFADTNIPPVGEDDLEVRLRECLHERRESLRRHLDYEYRLRPNYPGRETVEDGVVLLGKLLSHKGRAEFLTAVAKHDDELADLAEGLVSVDQFWGAQQKIFDKALSLKERLADDLDAVVEKDEQAADALRRIDVVLTSQKPQVQELPELCETVEGVHEAILVRARNEAKSAAAKTFADLATHAKERGVGDHFSVRLKGEQRQHEQLLDACGLVTQVDSARLKLGDVESADYCDIDAEVRRRARRKAAGQGEDTVPQAVTSGHGATGKGTNAGPVGVEPSPRRFDVVKVSRAAHMKLRTLTSEEDVDAYVQKVAAELKAALKGHDGIQLIN